jgi:hypothetical protein
VGKSKLREVFVEGFSVVAIGVVASNEPCNPASDAFVSACPGVSKRSEMTASAFEFSGSPPAPDSGVFNIVVSFLAITFDPGLNVLLSTTFKKPIGLGLVGSGSSFDGTRHYLLHYFG